MIKPKILFRISMVVLLGLTTHAEVNLPAVFSDHMVLQAGAPVPVWGRAEPGETVTVEFAGQTKTAVADSSNHWKITLDPMPATSNPRIMKVYADSNTPILQYSNLLVGEVWLCAGQSNMRMSVGGAENAEEEIANANFPEIRLFNIPEAADEEVQADVSAAWTVCSPKTIASMSAAGYFFGRKLNTDLGVPIGLINGSYGGTPIATWMDRETVENLDDNQVILNIRDALELYYENSKKKWEQTKEGPEPKRALPRYSGCCYNAMISPLEPFAMRGLIWYQGEADVNESVQYIGWYGAYLEMMRKKFENPDLWAFHVELAGFVNQHNTQFQPEVWARFRLAQQACLNYPNTGMATAMDVGEADQIHPKNKQEVGRRLALIALNQTYGKSEMVCEGPAFEALKKRGSKITVTFSHCDGGLRSKGELAGFSGVLKDGTTVELTGKIVGDDTVEIDLGGQEIERLRYAFANFPDCSLINGASLPALSFDQAAR